MIRISRSRSIVSVNGRMLCYGKCYSSKALWDSMFSFPFLKEGPVFPKGGYKGHFKPPFLSSRESALIMADSEVLLGHFTPLGRFLSLTDNSSTAVESLTSPQTAPVGLSSVLSVCNLWVKASNM